MKQRNYSISCLRNGKYFDYKHFIKLYAHCSNCFKSDRKQRQKNSKLKAKKSNSVPYKNDQNLRNASMYSAVIFFFFWFRKSLFYSTVIFKNT